MQVLYKAQHREKKGRRKITTILHYDYFLKIEFERRAVSLKKDVNMLKSQLAEKDAKLFEKDEQIELLKALLGQIQQRSTDMSKVLCYCIHTPLSILCCLLEHRTEIYSSF